jgi:hypothetical protein
MDRGALQHPVEIAGVIRSEPELAARPHDARQDVKRRAPDDSPLVMAELRPGVGKEDEDARERSCRKRGKNKPRIIDEEPDVAEPLPLDLGEQLDDAILEDLAADDPDTGMRCRLCGEMLAPAEADLEPDLVNRRMKECAGFERAGIGQRDSEPRQQSFQQVLLARAQLAAAPATIEKPLLRALLLGAQNARRSSSTRSSRSQEKPPSASGGRPKWP